MKHYFFHCIAILMVFILNARVNPLMGQPELMLQAGHEQGVDYGFFSHDGKLVYSVSRAENLCKIWEASSGKLLRNVPINAKEQEFYLMPTDANAGIFLLSDLSKLKFLNAKGDIISKTDWLVDGEPVSHHDILSGTLIFDNYDKKYYDVWDIFTGQRLLHRIYGSNKVLYQTGAMIEILDDRTLFYYDLSAHKFSDTIKLGKPRFGFFAKPIMSGVHKHLFYAAGQKIFYYDSETKSESELLSADSSVLGFIISVDESFLIVQTPTGVARYALTEDFGKLEIKEKLPGALINRLGDDYTFLSGHTIRVRNIGNNMVYDIKYNRRYYFNTSFDDIGHWGRSKDFDFNASKNLLAFTNKSSGGSIYSAGNNSVLVVDIATGDTVTEIKPGFNFTVSSASISQDGAAVLITGTNKPTTKGFVRLYNIKGRAVWEGPSGIRTETIYDEIQHLNIVNDSTMFTTMVNGGNKLWNLKKGNVSRFDGDAVVSDLVYPQLADAEIFSGNFLIKLLNCGTGKIIDTFLISPSQNKDFAIDLAISPGGKEIYFKTNFFLYRINVATRRVWHIPVSGDYSLTFYSTDTLLLNSALNNKAFNISNKEAISEIKCADCFLPADTHKKFVVEQEEKGGGLLIKIKSINGGRLLQSFQLAGEKSYAANYVISAPGIISTPIFSGDRQWLVFAGAHQVVLYKKDNLDKFSFAYIDSSLFTGITGVTFSNDSRQLYYITTDKKINVVELATINVSQLEIALPTQPKEIYFTPNNTIMVLLCSGNFIRLYDLVNRRDIGTLVEANRDSVETILTNGYYSLSGKSSPRIGFVNWPNFYPFDQLDARYNRPDKVLQTFENTFGHPDTALINSYYKAWQKRIKKLVIDTSSFEQGFSLPESDFKNRGSITYEQNEGNLKLILTGVDSTYKLDRYNLWVNEVPLFGMKGVNIRKDGLNSIEKTISLSLSEGENKIEASVTDVAGIESYRAPLYVRYTPKESAKEKLWFVGIGINHYKNGHDLKWSVKDIGDLADSLRRIYGDAMETYTLFDSMVSIKNVRALKEKLKNTGVNDKVIVVFSGHGLLSSNYDYYLSTYDVNFDKPEEGGLPFDDLEWLVDSISARRKLMLIDACHSGEVDKDEYEALSRTADSLGINKGFDPPKSNKPKNKLGLNNSFELMQDLFANVGRGTGATVISAAAGNQYALEKNDLKNGVFTYTILDLMRQSKEVSIDELKNVVINKVTQLTGGLQKPTCRNETQDNNWRVW